MPDQNPSEDTFTFVDKRRTTEAEPPLHESDPVDADDLMPEAELEDGPNAATVYDVGLYCAGLFASEALQRMGLIADQTTGKAVADLPQARVAIDFVDALVKVLDAPDSGLPDSLRRDLRRTLNDLRLNFVEQSRRASL